MDVSMSLIENNNLKQKKKLEATHTRRNSRNEVSIKLFFYAKILGKTSHSTKYSMHKNK